MLKLCTAQQSKKNKQVAKKQRFGDTMWFPEGLENTPFNTAQDKYYIFVQLTKWILAKLLGYTDYSKVFCELPTEWGWVKISENFVNVFNGWSLTRILQGFYTNLIDLNCKKNTNNNLFNGTKNRRIRNFAVCMSKT